MTLAKFSSKIILCVLTILFWGVAAGLSYIGANIFMTYERYGDLFTYLHSEVPAFILIGAAFLMFLIGVIGICGLFSENRCLLGVVSSSLLTNGRLEIKFSNITWHISNPPEKAWNLIWVRVVGKSIASFEKAN